MQACQVFTVLFLRKCLAYLNYDSFPPSLNASRPSSGVKLHHWKRREEEALFFHWVLYVISPFSGQKETFPFYLWCHGCAVYFGLWILHYGSEIHKIELFHNFSVGLKVRELGEKGIHIQILPLLLLLQNFPVCPAQWQTVFSPARENKETRMYWHYSTAGFLPFSLPPLILSGTPKQHCPALSSECHTLSFSVAPLLYP